MEKIVKTVVVICISIFSTKSIAGQPNILDKGKTTFYRESIDLAVDRLPPNFIGHSCAEISKKIKPLSLKKGEFETSSDFSSRLELMKKSKIYGQLNGESTYGFVVGKGFGLNATYDSDTGHMRVETYNKGSQILLSDNSSTETIIINKSKTGEKSYIGSNNFGKTVRVFSEKYNVCAIALLKSSPMPSSRFYVKVEFPISIEQAKLEKENIALLYIGNIDNPFYQEYTDYSNPTINALYETALDGSAIGFNLSQIWIFNKKTGIVYQKIGELIY